MKQFSGKVRLFCVSNIMVSFIGTGILGINGYTESIEGPVLSAHETSLTSSDTEPVSQFGEGEDNYIALITNGIKAVIEQQELALQDEGTTKEEEKKTEEKKTEAKKTTTKKTTTKKSTSKKTTSTKKSSKTTNVVTKKETKSSVTYAKATGSATGESIAAYAKKFLGLKYRSGVPSLSKGADCSGFTMLIYREYGISLPRTVGGQSKKGVAVSKKNLQKGDLVFYRPKGGRGLSHVAIYIGGGQVIHETRPGRGVAITSLDGLSNISYVTARRVINSGSVKKTETKVAEPTRVADTASNTTTTSTQNNKNEGNVDNNVVNNNVTTTTGATTNEAVVTPTPTPTPSPTPTPVVTPTPTPVVETKVEVVEEPKVDTKEESKPLETSAQ